MRPTDSPKDTGQPAETTHPASPRSPWEEPRLEFVEPALTKRGEMIELTADGFFGTFIPQ